MTKRPYDDPFTDCELGSDAILGTQTFEDVVFTDETETPVNVLTGETPKHSRATVDGAKAFAASIDTDTTWNLHVDEKHRRDLPDGSARVKILGAPGAYEIDWWSPEPGDGWEPVECGEFADIEEPADVSHLA